MFEVLKREMVAFDGSRRILKGFADFRPIIQRLKQVFEGSRKMLKTLEILWSFQKDFEGSIETLKAP
jgi:hypothetical protein